MPVQLTSTPATNAWQAMMTAFTRVTRRLAVEMEEEAEISLDWYGILLMLSQSESGTLRPSELAEQVGLSRSATTRLIDRIEREGLVQRSQCPADGRGFLVGLTGEGEMVFRRAGRVHLRGIDEHVGRHLSLAELAGLQTLLTKLAAGVEGNALSMIGSDTDDPG